MQGVGTLEDGPTALATVISRPSSTQAMPSAITMRVWKGYQFSLSIRAGTRVWTVRPVPFTSCLPRSLAWW